MRPFQHGDLVVAARIVATAPAHLRATVPDQLLWRADAADRYRKRTGQSHPLWGNGSLMGAALHYDRDQRRHSIPDRDVMVAMAEMLEAMLNWRHRNATRP